MANPNQEAKWNTTLDEALLQDLYAWIDQIPLSRPKRRIERDFSDGVMVAELVRYYFPNWVELHNYAAANNTQQKMINWGLLNRKVFSRFDLNVPEEVMRNICNGKTGVVENFLYNLRVRIDDYLYGMETNTSDPEYRNLFQKQKELNRVTPRGPLNINADYEVQPPPKIIPHNKQHVVPNIPITNVRKTNISVVGDVVPRMVYDEKEQECMAKEEQITILNAKIRRLEHLLHLKDVRIQDLTEKMEGPSNGKASKGAPIKK